MSILEIIKVHRIKDTFSKELVKYEANSLQRQYKRREIKFVVSDLTSKYQQK